ncbi:hypothetical protein G4B88_007611 [Cannabis sativa]|nr:hypothetical protein G4B88_007611 [Cannabis sativa]
MPKTILTIELPCISRAITTNTAAKSKVTIKFPLSIVLRRVDCQKRRELWFLINGKPVRFSLQEFAIVSELYTDGGPTPEEMELVSSKNKLKEKYFKNMMSIKITDVVNALDSISR